MNADITLSTTYFSSHKRQIKLGETSHVLVLWGHYGRHLLPVNPLNYVFR